MSKRQQMKLKYLKKINGEFMETKKKDFASNSSYVSMYVTHLLICLMVSTKHASTTNITSPVPYGLFHFI